MSATWCQTTVPAILAGALMVLPPLRAEDPPPIERRELVRSQNNLKQIGLAFHSAHDAFNKLPDDIRDKDEKALLSWRVAILPFIEEEKLYKEFKLDEPWDSADNKKLIEKMPKLYAPVRVKAKEGRPSTRSSPARRRCLDRKTSRRF